MMTDRDSATEGNTEADLERRVAERTKALEAEMLAHQQTEAALRASEEKYRLLIGGVVDYAIYMIDPQGNITSWNAGAERLKGYSAGEIIGRNFSIFYTEQDRRAGRPQRNLALALEKGRTEDEGWRQRKDGTTFWANVVITTLQDADGTLRGFAKVTRDLTERRAAENALRLKEEELAQSRKLEAIGRLAGGVAHDFNNLLTGIMGGAELLGMELPADHPLQVEIGDIQQAAERAASLTKQLLAFSRKQVMRYEKLNLSDILRDSQTLLGRIIGEHIRIETRLASELQWIHGDRGQVDQVILNLAVNARDAMSKGGTLVFTTENFIHSGEDLSLDIAPGSYVLMTVADTGSGMPKETLNKLFEPFFTTKEIGKGTGLGLSMVYGIAKQMGGGISVYSNVGVGTAFKVFLPTSADEFSSGRERSANANRGDSEAPGGSETILIVEDEEIVSNHAARVLRRKGYRVLVALSGADAIDLINREKGSIDLILADVIMPAMNGKELVAAVRKEHPNIKAIYMSGYPAEVIGSHGALDPDVKLIEKPFYAARLLQEIRRALDA